MHEQAVQLVQPHPPLPPRRRRVHLVVAGQDRLQVRCAEQRQQRQVGLPVPAVRGRVDERDAVAGSTSRCPTTGHRGAGPGVVGVERPGADPGDESVEGRRGSGRRTARRRGTAGPSAPAGPRRRTHPTSPRRPAGAGGAPPAGRRSRRPPSRAGRTPTRRRRRRGCVPATDRTNGRLRGQVPPRAAVRAEVPVRLVRAPRRPAAPPASRSHSRPGRLPREVAGGAPGSLLRNVSGVGRPHAPQPTGPSQRGTASR